jgi:hypothetical protein
VGDLGGGAFEPFVVAANQLELNDYLTNQEGDLRQALNRGLMTSVETE